MKELPDFKIEFNGEISELFLSRNIQTFQEAAEFIQNLNYGRNSNKDDLKTLFSDNKGTCSTKHAVLKQLASENNFNEVKLFLGIFKMNKKNSPKVAKTLTKNGLNYIPEAHNYLKFNNIILDFTKPNSSAKDFVKDLIFETEIKINEINKPKIEKHKLFLQNWLKENPKVNLTLEEIWKIREDCIQDLSN